MTTSGWDKAGVVVAGLALVTSVGSLFIANNSVQDARTASEESRRVAEEANGVAQKAYALAERAAQQEIASRVFLGEAPPKYEQRGNPIWAVSNNSGIDVTQVWVEVTVRGGTKGHVQIGSVQQCHLYTLNESPGDYFPVWLHFFDGSQHWKRDLDGAIQIDSQPKVPESLARVGSPDVHQMVGTCGG